MGKTTLLKAIMGLLPATGGRIVIDGVDVTQWPAHERSRLGIGYVPQGRGILPGLTAQENLRLAWTPDSGETEESAIERVVGLLPRLSRLLDRRGGTLSGGEQQILALARALVGSPWLLILDEPSEGIQPSIVEEIGAILTRLRDSHRLSLLIVEQNLELVLDVATRVVLVERGRITRTLDPGAVRGGAVAELVGLGARIGSSAPVRASTRTARRRRAAAGPDPASITATISVSVHHSGTAARAASSRGTHVDRQAPYPRPDEPDRRFAAHEHVGAGDRRISRRARRHVPGL